MKKFNLNKITVLLVALVALTGCVEDDKFDLPNISTNVVDFPADQKISIGAILGAYNQEGEPVTLEYTSDRYMEGYIVSSDEGGNFNGLTVAEDNGVIQLGRLSGDELDRISGTQINDVIIRTDDVATIVAKEVTIEDFPEISNTSDDSYLLESQYIRLSNMQFNRFDVLIDNPLTFASESTDSFDGEREMENCDTNATVILSTSTFSDFKGLTLPSNKGTIDGVLTRDFFDDIYTIYINSPEAINFDDPERCDPFDINDFDIVYEEDFTDGLVDWEVTNTVGTKSWVAADFGGEFYVRGSAFSGGSIVQMVSWLISPPFDFDAQVGEQMVLEIADAFNNGEPLKAYYSNDYVSGNDPSTATWTEVGTNEIEALSDNTGFFDNEYDQTGLIDLTAVTGNAVIAFVYDSNNATVSSSMDLSDVKILTPQ